MRTMILLFALTNATACTSALEDATTATILTRQSLELVDAVWTPLYTSTMAQADADHPDDEAAFAEATAKADRVHKSIEAARSAQQLLRLAVDQWRAGDEGATWADVAPCALDDLAAMAEAISGVNPPAGARVAAAVGTIAAIVPVGACVR